MLRRREGDCNEHTALYVSLARAVGIPARIVESAETGGRFAAYAVARDMNDPVAQVIHELIAHAAETDRRFETLLAELRQRGVDVQCESASPLDTGHLNKMVD